MAPRLVIFTDDVGWHATVLSDAFHNRGCTYTHVSLTDCHFDIETGKNGLHIPGFEDTLPNGAFVRGVPGGSLEAVIFYLDVLHALRELNVLVYNDACAIERSVDKAMTSFLLSRAGIATPPTWVGNDVHQAYAFIRRQLMLGHKVVAKPLFGSQGKNLQLITRLQDLADFSVYNGVYYLQRFVPTGATGARDWRLFIIGKQVFAAMQRKGSDWISNVANGGKCYPAVPSRKFIDTAKRAMLAVNMHYGGVDLMLDTEGKLWVTEINSIPAWKGLQSVTRANVAERLAEHFLSCLQARSGVNIAHS